MDETDGKKRLSKPPIEVNWDGAMAKHSFTDIPCLILFVLFLLCWGGVGVYSIANGNIDTVRYSDNFSSVLSNSSFIKAFNLCVKFEFFLNAFQILYPADTSGRICGTEVMKNKKYLLYFDLSRCLNPAVLAMGCNTPQVIVFDCSLN